jgi:hypothetical protein
MRISGLAIMMTLATMALPGCGGDTSKGPSEDFELQGSWVYLGPWDGEHTLKISNTSMKYASLSGDWSSNWTVKQYDNGLHHFRITLDAGTGNYYPVGRDMSGTYVVENAILTIQLAISNDTGSYPALKSPGSCTEEGGLLIEDCRLYMKQP